MAKNEISKSKRYEVKEIFPKYENKEQYESARRQLISDIVHLNNSVKVSGGGKGKISTVAVHNPN